MNAHKNLFSHLCYTCALYMICLTVLQSAVDLGCVVVYLTSLLLFLCRVMVLDPFQRSGIFMSPRDCVSSSQGICVLESINSPVYLGVLLFLFHLLPKMHSYSEGDVDW